jgi:hypothetical protein
VHGENHQHTTSHGQTLSHNVVLSTPRLSGIQTHNVSDDSYCLVMPCGLCINFCCAYLKPEPGFLASYVTVFFVFNDLMFFPSRDNHGQNNEQSECLPRPQLFIPTVPV